MLNSTHLKATAEEELDQQNNLLEFKGMYFNDNHEQKYCEGGAHFKYRDLCSRLEKYVLTLTPERRGKTMYQDWSKETDKIKEKEKIIKKKLKGKIKFLLFY
jgi:hypothetical protein